MKAILRLVLTFTAGTRVLRAFSIAGVSITALAFLMFEYLPQAGWMLWLSLLGPSVLFLGSSLMPLLFGRMAQGRLILGLPYGRVKLLAGVFITVSLVALPIPLLEYVGFRKATNFYLEHPHGLTASHLAISAVWIERARQGAIESLWLTLTATFLTTCGLYLTLWFITSQRSIAGYVKGLLVILFMMYIPNHRLTGLSTTMVGSLSQIGAVCFLFGAGFLLWPRWRAMSRGWRLAPKAYLERLVRRPITGREADLVLGTANPWLLIGAQVVPIIFATTIGFYSAAVWLFYLTIFSTVAGAIACQAAERSRVLWLRGGWLRTDLFGVVERSFWRHNGFVLGSLMVLMLAIGTYAALPVSLLVAGLPLLVISTVLSTYLGLMVTRSLRFAEGALAVIAMLALMVVAVIAARSGGSGHDILIVVAMEAALATTALALRATAKSRWASIDWMLCRPERALRTRAAA